MYTVHEQTMELIACNVAIMRTRLSDRYTNMHVYRWQKTSFVLEPKRVWHWRQSHLWLEMKAFSAGDYFSLF